MNMQHIKWGPLALIVAIVGIIALMTLWPYKELVGLTFLGLFALGVIVTLRGQLNEQSIRHLRYQPQQEEPLPSAELPCLQQGGQYSHYRPLAPSSQYSLQDDFYRHEPEEVKD